MARNCPRERLPSRFLTDILAWSIIIFIHYGGRYCKMKKLVLGLLLGLLCTNAHAGLFKSQEIHCQASSITCSNATSVLEACNLTRGRGDRVEFRENLVPEIEVYENGFGCCLLVVEAGERVNELMNVGVRIHFDTARAKLEMSGDMMNVVSRVTNKTLVTIHLEKEPEYLRVGPCYDWQLYTHVSCEGPVIIRR